MKIGAFKVAVIFLVLLGTFGCVTPEYRLVPYALLDNPPVSYQQAWSICSPQAEIAGDQARQAVVQHQQAAANQVTGYKCKTAGQSYHYGSSTSSTYKTECTPQRAGGGTTSPWTAIALGIGQAEEQQRAYQRTRDQVLNSCMAQHGWGFKKICVENCY